MIKWFFHVAFMSAKVKDIVDEMLQDIEHSWLLEITDELHIGVIWWIVKINNPKIIVHYFWNNMRQYEFPTLKILVDECKKNPEMQVYYMHTKWASKPFSPTNISWRRDMIKCIVNNHKLCIEKLKNYDTVWTKVYLSWQYPRHYSWNFRWANASYINKLPPLEGKESDRFRAEFRLLWTKPDVLFCNIP